MIANWKIIKTKRGLSEILSIEFDNKSEFDNLMDKLSNELHQMNDRDVDVVVIGTMEFFIQALYDHYNERFNNTFLWGSEVSQYEMFIKELTMMPFMDLVLLNEIIDAFGWNQIRI